MLFSTQSALHQFADRLSTLSPLAAADRAAILAIAGRTIQARANADIVRTHEKAEHACLVVEGLVGRFEQMRDGNRQITALHIAGDMADLHAVATPGMAFPIQALSTTTAICIPLAQLRAIALHHPAVAAAFWAYCAVDAAVLAKWMGNVGRKSAAGRLAHLLCEMAMRMEQAGQGDPHGFLLEATQTQLGDVLGLTSVHVSRTFTALREAGLIETGGRMIRIADWKGLAAAGDFDAAYLRIPPQAGDGAQPPVTLVA